MSNKFPVVCSTYVTQILCVVMLYILPEVLHNMYPRTSIHYADGHLTARTLEDSKQRDSSLNFSNRSEIWQACQQQRWRDACQISERCNHYNLQSSAFETPRDLAVRRLIASWIEAHVVSCCVFTVTPTCPQGVGRQGGYTIPAIVCSLCAMISYCVLQTSTRYLWRWWTQYSNLPVAAL